MTLPDIDIDLYRHAAPRVLTVSADPEMRIAAQLDQELFTTPVFTIDRRNDFVARHATFSAARQAVAQRGNDVSWVVTARPGVAVVDIDLASDDDASLVMSEIAKWCAEHSVWSCVRRSGGGYGRWHVIAVPAELSPVLYDFVVSVRTHHGFSSREVDWRAAVRPLTAPHRATGVVTVPEDLRRLSDGLSRSLRRPGVSPEGDRRWSTCSSEPIARLGDAVRPLRPLFEDGLRREHRKGADRSAVEFGHTRDLVLAGLSEAEAWAIVADPNNLNFRRSRERGRRWWRTYQWNRVTRPAPAPKPPVGVQKTLWRGEYDWTRVVLPMARGVRHVWDRWPTRQRHIIDHIAAVTADYATRRGLGPQPMSCRMLTEDTGYDPHTCAKALRELVEANVLVLTERYDPSRDRGQGRTGSKYAVNLLALDFRPADVDHTPSSYTPPMGSPLWLLLPPGSASHWLNLCLQTTLSMPPPALTELHKRGLVRRTGRHWLPSRRTRYTQPRMCLAAWVSLRAAMRKAREDFRSAMRQAIEIRKAAFERGREESRLRQAARDAARRRAWLTSLSDEERHLRRAEWQARWESLSRYEQFQRKEELRERRRASHRGRALVNRQAISGLSLISDLG